MAERWSWRLVAMVLLAVTGMSACGNPPTAVIRIDNSYDEFATSMIDFFPDTIVVHPGQTVRFRQRWTGEAHSVTFGAMFNNELGRIRDRLREPLPPDADDLPELARFESLPVMMGRGDQEFAVNQNGAQPCYLETGSPPTDPDQPCPQRPQPTFTGKQSYYSSGFIPFRGKAGNRFDVPLAKDIEPGSYNFYCNLHGVAQSGTVQVVAADQPLPDQAGVDRGTRKLIDERYGRPLSQALESAKAGEITIGGAAYETPLAGAATTEIRPWGGSSHRRHFGHRHGSVDEFVPRAVTATVGRPVSWTFVGRHTVSFNVPAYLPVFAVGANGTVRTDPRVNEAAGWTVRGPRNGDVPLVVDAGEWDGRGFRSTGLDWRTGDRFSVTFTRPGTYPMACLVHPAMVGKVVVKPS